MTEAQAREWILKGLQWMAEGATLTPTTADDKTVAIAITAVESNTIWNWVWKLVGPAFESDGEILVGAADDAPQELVVTAEQAGIDPITVITLIMAILDFIKNRRK